MGLSNIFGKLAWRFISSYLRAIKVEVGTEALGLVLCEASACGRPIIASDLNGIPEALVDLTCGTLIPPGSVDALEQAMLHWARQTPWTFARRMEVHQTVASQFSLEAAARRYLEIYRSLR